MIKCYIYDRQAGLQEAANLCGSVKKLKKLITYAKGNASPETPIFIGGKILTIARK